MIASIELPAEYIGICHGQKRARTSKLSIGGNSWQRVLDLTRLSGSTRYVTGHGAALYLDHDSFEAAGIGVDYMCYSKKIWPQLGINFTPYVSVLDLIANTGPTAITYLQPVTQNWRSFLSKRVLK